MIPQFRIGALNDVPANPKGEYVLHSMIAYRRTGWKFALHRALEWSEEFVKPLVVFEAFYCGYRWASDGLHRLVLDGMADNRSACRVAAELLAIVGRPGELREDGAR
jgi:deoxyribodipyrimidine photo-lyase